MGSYFFPAVVLYCQKSKRDDVNCPSSKKSIQHKLVAHRQFQCHLILLSTQIAQSSKQILIFATEWLAARDS